MLFLLDWLIEGNDGYLETNPSTSPEHNFIAPDGNIACVSYSSTMDMAIIREVFSAFISATKVKLLILLSVLTGMDPNTDEWGLLTPVKRFFFSNLV